MKLPAATPAFGPASVGRVEPPSLAQMILRARARLTERERFGGKLLLIGGILIAIFPFWIDLLGFAGVIAARSRLSTSFLLRNQLAGWSLTLVDGACVLLEFVLILGAFIGASRLGAGRPRGVWLLSVLGAAGFILWVPLVWGAAVEVFPTDPMSALLACVLPGLGFAGCAVMVVGGLVARMRPVRPYTR